MQEYFEKGLAFKTNPPNRQYELECRVKFTNVNAGAIKKKFQKYFVSQDVVQKFEAVDIYNSQKFRIKKLILKKSCFFPPFYILPFYLSIETDFYSIDDVHFLKSEKFKQYTNIAYYLVHPIKRLRYKYTDFIDIKLWQNYEDITTMIIECECDPTKNINLEIFKKEMDIFIDLIKMLKSEFDMEPILNYNFKSVYEPTTVLKNADVLLAQDYFISPKWNGVKKKIKFEDSKIVFESQGFDPTLIVTNKKICALKEDYPFIYYLFEHVGFVVEYLSPKKIIIIDICLSEKVLDRIYILKNITYMLKILQKYDVYLELQSYHSICFEKILQIPIDPTCTDGYIITTYSKVYKLKPRCHQTIDLLYNVDKKFITAEGIELSSNIILGDIIPQVNHVYEFRIIKWLNMEYEIFHKLSKIQKLKILKNCTFKCIKCRYDRGSTCNSFVNICNYLESDLMYVLTMYKMKHSIKTNFLK